MSYDPHAPAERQAAEWNCSCASAAWALQSLGFPVTEAEVTGEMVALGLVTEHSGLMDGSGGGLADYLAAKSGYPVVNRYMSWADVQAAAGEGPICQGSGTMYHWSAIRYEQGNIAYMMNPAPGWKGVGDQLDRWAWESWGPWAGCFIAVGEDPVTIAQLEAENASLKEQNASLNAELALERSWNSSAISDTLVPVAGMLDTALLAQMPQDWPTVESARQSLLSNLGI